MLVLFTVHPLARILHEGNEVQGKYGKQGWLIARRCIAIATHQGGSTKIGRQIFPDFVQVQTVFFEYQGFFSLFIEFINKYRK